MLCKMVIHLCKLMMRQNSNVLTSGNTTMQTGVTGSITIQQGRGH